MLANRACVWISKCAAACCSQDELADVKNFNFDHPSAFDTPALLECVNGLKAGRPVDVPTYDFNTHRRATETKRVSRQACDRRAGFLSVCCMPEWVGCHACAAVGLAKQVLCAGESRGFNATGRLAFTTDVHCHTMRHFRRSGLDFAW